MSRLPTLVGVCLLAMAGSLAAAQREDAKPQAQLGHFGMRGWLGPGASTDAWSTLLRSERVREELDVSPEQLDELKKISQKATERVRNDFAEMQRLRDAGREERKAKFAQIAKNARTHAEDTSKEIERVLRPQQLARLKQMALQVHGVSALENEQIQNDLKLTEEQKKQLRALRDGVAERVRSGGRPVSDEERKASREKLNALRKEREAKVLRILTAEQRARFEEMKGPKFDLNILPSRPRSPRTP